MSSLFQVKQHANKGTSKVLFSCHKDDFDKYFSELTDEILSIQDCSIYYLEDQGYIPEDIEDYQVQLSQFNLIVFPITYKFLSENNRAKDIDLTYTIDNGHPILPILVEPELYDILNKSYSVQALDRLSNDPTQDSYKVKLEKYLKSVLVDDETTKKIRDAFDAYIFLSYRKKDRKYAQEIMSIIHKNDFMRDIAIWYDEFLTPGEDFNNEISDNLLKSKLMTLVVTPNINERYGEKGNYVIEAEYPHAIKENKPVLPIEAVGTNREELKKNFKDIEAPINKENYDEITSYFKKFIIKNGLDANDNDPEHLYFIGLAYLNGIDTNRDTSKAIKIFEKVANDNYIPAIKELVNIYENGIGANIDYSKAIEFQRKLITIIKNNSSSFTENESYENNNLAMLYSKYGMSNKAIDILEKNSTLCKSYLGEEHPRTLECLSKLIKVYNKSGRIDNNNRLEISKKIYRIRKETFGDDSIETIEALSDLANCYRVIRNGEKALEYSERVYLLYKSMLGERHKITISSLNDLSEIYKMIKKYDQYLRLKEEAYNLSKEVLGEDHPDTFLLLNNLGLAYAMICNNLDKGIELLEKSYNLRCKTFGENHPFVFSVLHNLKYLYNRNSDEIKKAEIEEKIEKWKRMKKSDLNSNV